MVSLSRKCIQLSCIRTWRSVVVFYPPLKYTWLLMFFWLCVLNKNNQACWNYRKQTFVSYFLEYFSQVSGLSWVVGRCFNSVCSQAWPILTKEDLTACKSIYHFWDNYWHSNKVHKLQFNLILEWSPYLERYGQSCESSGGHSDCPQLLCL